LIIHDEEKGNKENDAEVASFMKDFDKKSLPQM
jgi:hypothetical protein